MNGVMPGPLWLAIASAANRPSTSSGIPAHQPISDTVAGKKGENQESIASRQPKSDGDDGTATAAGESGDPHGRQLLWGCTRGADYQVVQRTIAKCGARRT